MNISFDSPYLNQPMANSLRQPRGIVTINNIQVKFKDIEITTNHFYESDTFRINLPLNEQPTEFNLQYLSLAGLFEVKVYIGFPPNPDSYSTQDLPLFITGNITDFSINLVTGIITIHGRDLSSRLIDRKLTQGFSSSTLSQIAELFALQNNLIPNVEATTEKIGIFYKNDWTVLSTNTTEWDLLTGIAQLQNFVVYVNNNTLVCIERAAAENARSPYLLNYQQPNDPDLIRQIVKDVDTQTAINITDGNAYPTFNGMNLVLNRTPYSDIFVTVIVPYSAFSKQFISVTVSSTNRHRNNLNLPTALPRRFVHKYFGLSRQQAQLKAQQLLNSYLIHEFEISAQLPADNLLLKDSLIQLSGTNTEFDQVYYPDEIVRTLSTDDGYMMSVNAKSKNSKTVFSINNINLEDEEND